MLLRHFIGPDKIIRTIHCVFKAYKKKRIVLNVLMNNKEILFRLIKIRTIFNRNKYRK